MSKKEEATHLAVCNYLRIKHPDIIFRTDFSSGMKMTPGQAVKHKKFQSSRSYPDLFIAETKDHNGFYGGMYLEIKADGVQIYKKDGTLRKNDHIKEQDEMLKELRSKGYYAEFGLGFDDCIKKIEEYLAL